MNGTRDALRVVIEPEPYATFPADWGWDEADTADYMRDVERGEIEVVWMRVQARCGCCGTWHDTGDGDAHLPSLGDVHVKSDDLYPLDDDGRLRIVTEDAIPLGPNYPRDLIERVGADRLDAYALPLTSSDNYLIEQAAQLMDEARSEAQDAAQAV